jgi:hypothetical protein
MFHFMIRSSLINVFPADLLNGTYACEHDKLMNDIIKREFGFQGCEYLSPVRHYLLTFSPLYSYCDGLGWVRDLITNSQT